MHHFYEAKERAFSVKLVTLLANFSPKKVWQNQTLQISWQG
jgi:hypothetical protein